MRSVNNYIEWADALRKRYGHQFEAEKQAIEVLDSAVDLKSPTVEPGDVERQRTVVADLKARIADVSEQLRTKLLAALERAAGSIAARELVSARAEFPDLLPPELTPAQHFGLVTRANMPGGVLALRREKMAEIAAYVLSQFSSDETSNLGELHQKPDSLAKGVEELRTALRNRHKVQATVLSGLETVIEDRAFHKLIEELTVDAELEAQWRLDQDIVRTLTSRSSGGKA